MSKERTSTMQYWGILTVCSAVSLGALCEETKNGRGSAERFAISVSSIGTILGFLFLVMSKWTSVSGAPNHLNGTAVELVVAGALAFLWAVGLGVINSYIIGDSGVVVNANIYYFSWGAFISTILLCASIFQDSTPEMEETPTKFTRWAMLLVSSVIVLSSSSSIWRQSNCNQHTPFCKRTALGIGMGTTSAFFSILVLVLGKASLQRGKPNEFLQVEFLVSLLLCVAFAVSVGFITGPDGPASTIGNLYYFTWISFVTSVTLFLACVHEFDPQSMLKGHLPEGAVTGETPEA